MSNPVSLRLYNVLGTTFDDDATTAALHTLSELYAPPAPSKPDATDDPDDDDDDARHESAPAEHAARARRGLRRDMEARLADGSRQFLRAFAEVDQNLDALQAHAAAMRAACDQAEAQLRLTGAAGSALLERAGSLRSERQDVDARRAAATAVLARFTLTDEQAAALASRDVPVGPRFFAAMDAAVRVRSDCRVLMAGDAGPSQLGLDAMAAAAAHLEHGFAKLARWCAHEFRQLGRDAQLDVAPGLCEAVRRLRERPELLTEALALLAHTRQQTLLGAFLAALTRGGPGGLPRPIELHAHDPMRYVGDMLAWVHQAIAAEHDFLEGLFGATGDGRMVGSVRVFSAGAEEEGHWVRELMDQAVGKLCVPLKVRVQQTVRSQESSIVLYKVANLLQFYMLTMRRTLGDDALLSRTLLEITDVAYAVFFGAVEAQGRALLRISLDADDPSVAPPPPILDHAQVLREIATVYQSSLLGDERPPAADAPEASHGAAGFQRILDVMVDPALQMCETAAEEKARLRARWDREVFGINCLTHLQGVLEPFPFAADKQRAMQARVDERVARLTEQHHDNLLADAGLRAAVAALSAPPDARAQEPLSRLPGTAPPALQAALRAFALWLSGPGVVQSPRLARLTAQRLHAEVHQAALARVAASYGALCAAVRSTANKYEAASTLLGGERPFGQVHLLWQIFGLEEPAGA